ncbi:MAG: Holliday junction branch migration protein RuvA [Bdellovibrionota bacterium]
MIGYLQGKVLWQVKGRMLVGIGGEGCLVGYNVIVPQNISYSGFNKDMPVELFIYTHVREDALDLYGFKTSIEKELFTTLLGATGVGPKMAIGIMSGAEPPRIINAILGSDKEFLTQIPGIGKKTAERLVLELKDSLKKKADEGVITVMGGEMANKSPASAYAMANSFSDSGFVRDAKTALTSLGYKEQDAARMISDVMNFHNDTTFDTVEDLVRAALRSGF